MKVLSVGLKRIFVGLGSNLGDLSSNLDKAISEISKLADTRIVKQSDFYKTPPEGNTDQPSFLNAVVEITTCFPPRQLLKQFLMIEEKLGRVRTTKWASRVIDLDLLFYGNEITRDEDLIIPHSLMHKRWFVLRPLAEIAPEAVHPVLKKSIKELLGALPQQKYEDN